MTQLLSPELLARLERMELVSRKIFRGRLKGERRSRRKGQSVEFTDFRNYVAGDDLRFIDWNLYARLDRLYLKLFLEEEDLHFHTIVDASESMNFGEPTKLFYAKQLAASLGFVGLCRADRVQIQTLGEASPASAVWRGRSELGKMLDYLTHVSGGENISLTEGIKRFCLRRRGRGIVVLITDLLDKTGYETALRMLAARDLDTYLIHVMAPEELDPELTGDLNLVDCEDGETTDISISRAVLNRYQETVASYCEQAREFCTRRSITYLRANTEVPVEQLIGTYLRERGLVR